MHIDGGTLRCSKRHKCTVPGVREPGFAGLWRVWGLAKDGLTWNWLAWKGLAVGWGLQEMLLCSSSSPRQSKAEGFMRQKPWGSACCASAAAA